MIKPINITPLNTTSSVSFKCPNCHLKSSIEWSNRVINIDNEHEVDDLQKEECPVCGFPLGGMEALKKVVELMEKVVKDLEKESSSNKKILTEYKVVISEYNETGQIDVLKGLRKISCSPSIAGEDTDFTEVTPVKLGQDYIALGEILSEIEDLLFYL